ncbi:hypothetical protein GIB67_034427 [Kingdonia uniflora]|uniref:Uncharacterized protein n=1 Tax=Kingdonia uniflora TaxID=39325 RepID=A0A7J7PAT8_9MAGN|nr:hypothetical protein GIB67_034427 [Kingdonia uniflora]
MKYATVLRTVSILLRIIGLYFIYKGFSPRQGISSPISDLTGRLLLEERNPPPVPQESLYKAPPFDEVDIQALAHAVELTRQGVVDSLEHSKCRGNFGLPTGSNLEQL